jgi:hypothetical protein
MSSCCFAVIPDDGIVDQKTPVALFASIEDAMDWALSRWLGNCSVRCSTAGYRQLLLHCSTAGIHAGVPARVSLRA